MVGEAFRGSSYFTYFLIGSQIETSNVIGFGSLSLNSFSICKNIGPRRMRVKEGTINLSLNCKD